VPIPMIRCPKHGIVKYKLSYRCELCASEAKELPSIELKKAIALVRSEATFLKPSLFNEFNSYLSQIEQRTVNKDN